MKRYWLDWGDIGYTVIGSFRIVLFDTPLVDFSFPLSKLLHGQGTFLANKKPAQRRVLQCTNDDIVFE